MDNQKCVESDNGYPKVERIPQELRDKYSCDICIDFTAEMPSATIKSLKPVVSVSMSKDNPFRYRLCKPHALWLTQFLTDLGVNEEITK